MKSYAGFWIILIIAALITPPIMYYIDTNTSTTTTTITVYPHSVFTLATVKSSSSYCEDIQMESASGAAFDFLVVDSEEGSYLANYNTEELDKYARSSIPYFYSVSRFNIYYKEIKVKILKNHKYTLVFVNPSDNPIAISLKMKIYPANSKCTVPYGHSSIVFEKLVGYHSITKTVDIESITLKPNYYYSISPNYHKACILYNIKTASGSTVDVLVMDTNEANYLQNMNKFSYYADKSAIGTIQIKREFYMENPNQYSIVIFNPHKYPVTISLSVFANLVAGPSDSCKAPQVIAWTDFTDLVNKG